MNQLRIVLISSLAGDIQTMKTRPSPVSPVGREESCEVLIWTSPSMGTLVHLKIDYLSVPICRVGLTCDTRARVWGLRGTRTSNPLYYCCVECTTSAA